MLNTDNILHNADGLLKGNGFDYSICGGFALDLFLGKTVRKHGDIDICVYQEDRAKIIDYMINIGWNVYEFCGNGIIHLLSSGSDSVHIGNLMCVYDDCELLTTNITDKKNYFHHNFLSIGITKLNYMEFLFNDRHNGKTIFDKDFNVERDTGKAFLKLNGLKYLAPEIILYFKANNPELKNNIDFDTTVNFLNDDQKTWLKQSVIRKHGDNHFWLSKI